MNKRVLVLVLAALIGGGCTSGVRVNHGLRDGSVSDGPIGTGAPDQDGDGISDEFEGRAAAGGATDTDGDGTPDYMDTDSDGDGILDSIEGNTVSGVAPVDTDGDGTPDFRDLDSDGNGITDMVEGAGDVDGDHTPDFRDLDNDGDVMRDLDEIGSSPAAPVDFDTDGVADFDDPDSDNDTIRDDAEGPWATDTDTDMVPDFHDLDSDNDGYTDAMEAGDADLTTPPFDTDLDGIPDFRDPDADNDGLSDSQEHMLGTNPLLADTDGDGVTDLIEVAACPPADATCTMDATTPTSSPRTRGGFVFLEPYMLPPDPTMDTLLFSTSIRQADVYFLVDTTGSMSSEITSLNTSLAAFASSVVTAIPDVWVGLGEHKDYPTGGYGGSGDFAYHNHANLTADVATVNAQVAALRASGGSDGPESQVPALYATATGMGLPGTSGGSGSSSTCPAGFHGYPCFRDGAVPIIVLITDVSFHNGPGGSNAYSDGTIGGHAPTYAETIAALNTNNTKVIGINCYGGATDENALSTDTGSVDGTGAPLVSTWSGGAIGMTVLNQIQTLANNTMLDVSIQFHDDPSDGVDTQAAFLDHLEAKVAGDATRGCEPHAADDTDGDGHPDTFRGVTAGHPVCFDIYVKQNDTVMPTPMPQLFRATLQVLGNGFTTLDTRDIYFLVPPHVTVPDHPFG